MATEDVGTLVRELADATDKLIEESQKGVDISEEDREYIRSLLVQCGERLRKHYGFKPPESRHVIYQMVPVSV